MSPDSRKKPRYSDEESVLLFKNYNFGGQAESRFSSPEVDPEKLCPYCDRLLPAEPSAKLVKLLEDTLHKSYRDARPSNALGLKTSSAIFSTVCHQHIFESETMALALKNSWPTSIDWEILRERVAGMEVDLRAILADPGPPIVYPQSEPATPPSLQQDGPRMRCIFWRDILRALETVGSRGVSGVAGQFATFEKTQPGYYGELGAVIIHEALFDMFPENAVNREATQPLGLREFIARVLVPEVGMRLILQDLGLDSNDVMNKERGVAVMIESASYGVAMFPDEGEA
ncbi:RTC4-like domain-containing protein [Mycena polygramma]|nr:RTC4-like domain-containing protein [Mycena polygramma]